MPRRRLLAALALTLALGHVPPGAALNCKRACKSTIKACVAQECNPPAFNVPKKVCVLGALR